MTKNSTLEIGQAEKLIPHGCYCYDEQGVCPFWEKIIKEEEGHEYETGYCYFLQEEDCILLWDQCKICGENDFTQEELEEMAKELLK